MEEKESMHVFSFHRFFDLRMNMYWASNKINDDVYMQMVNGYRLQ